MYTKPLFCMLISILLTVLLCTAVQGEPSSTIEAHEVPDFVPQLLEIARGEIGYTEGPNNYTKYGEWTGDPNAQWCAEFICWCVNQCDVLYQTELLHTVYPYWTGQNTGRDWFITQGRFVYRKGNCPSWGYQWEKGADHYLVKNEYIPGPGDLLFFSYSGNGDTMHVALIEYVDLNEEGELQLHVIEGNNPDRVQQNVYLLNNNQILGFGLCSDQIDTVMRPGNRGTKVTELQQGLYQLGYLTEENISGSYLGATKAAVAAFQEEHMTKRNYYGIADRETVQMIQAMIQQAQTDESENWLVEDE